MKLGKIGLVLVVVIALVGLYYFAPNLLQGIGSDEVRLSVRIVNVPDYIADDMTARYWLDGNEVGSSFTVKVGTSHSFQVWAVNGDGTLYATFTKMFNAPDESGSYALEIDGTTRTVTVVSL